MQMNSQLNIANFYLIITYSFYLSILFVIRFSVTHNVHFVFVIVLDALDTASRPPLSTVPIRLRFQVGPEAEKFAKGAAERGYLMLRVQQLQLQMLASSMENISELFRDTVTSEAMPLHINLHNIDVTLKVCANACKFTTYRKI